MAGVGRASKMSTLELFSRTGPRQVTKTTNLKHGCVTKDVFITFVDFVHTPAHTHSKFDNQCKQKRQVPKMPNLTDF